MAYVVGKNVSEAKKKQMEDANAQESKPSTGGNLVGTVNFSSLFSSPNSVTITKPNKLKLRSTTPSLTAQYQKMETEAQAANKALEAEIRGNYQKTIDMYSANGSFMQAGNLDIANQEKNIVGQEMQSLISSGLYGTTTASAIPGKVASQFTQPARLKLEDLANQRVAGARSEFSQFLNTIQNNYPDYNMLLEAMRAQNSV